MILAALALLAVSAGPRHEITVEARFRSEVHLKASVNDEATDHKFTFKADQAGIKQVFVAGSFNNWTKDATPLTLESDGRTWDVHLKLAYGKYQYKFILNGETWITDPAAPSVSDGNGHLNSVLVVQPPDYDRAASPNDGVTAVSALRHVEKEPDLNFDQGKLRFTLRARPNDLASVYLRVNGQRIAMKPWPLDDLYEIYEGYLPWDRQKDLTYDFELHDGGKTASFGADGYTVGADKPFRLVAKEFHPFIVPSWVEKSVIYQIFPDRFADGDKSNDPPNVEPWGARPTYSNRFGGDTAGVEQHLDYLSQLGVGTVYFTPVFESPSNHRYDATDYRKIDPEFGTNAEFDQLTRDMKAKGIRTVIDLAFNHTATNFWAFKDIREKGEASDYKNWYFIKSYPVVVKENPPYVAWFNYPSMPKLNVMNPATHSYLLGTVNYWLENAHIAGIRLDTGNEVDQRFWRDLRVDLKAKDPQAWICGEFWGDANPWLQGDQWDSTMGYQFRDACIQYFAERTTKPSQFMGALMGAYRSYAPQVSRNLMNLLGSHDTPRFLTLCHGDVDLLKLAATVEFTWPGAPTVYYGDELGMEGDKDPDNRRCMDWSKATDSNPVLAYYKKLIHLRNISPVLQSGEPEVLMTNDADGLFAYDRTLGAHTLVVAVNGSRETRQISLHLPQGCRGDLIDVLTSRQMHSSGASLSITLPPLGAVVLSSVRDVQTSSFSQSGTKVADQHFSSGHRSPF